MAQAVLSNRTKHHHITEPHTLTWLHRNLNGLFLHSAKLFSEA